MHPFFAFVARTVPLLLLAAGCASTLEELPPTALDIRLDVNTRVYGPHVPVRIKFWVDLINQSGGAVSPENLRIELQVFRVGQPQQVVIKQSWSYATGADRTSSGASGVVIGAGKTMKIPILPERHDPNATASDFPLKLLPEGQYQIVAVINDRHVSRPCELRIERPDLQLLGRPR